MVEIEIGENDRLDWALKQFDQSPNRDSISLDPSDGDGWVCTKSADARTATCTTPNGIKQGAAYPPIQTVFAIPSTTKGPLTIESAVASKDDGNPANDTHKTDPITVTPAPPPDLVVKTTPDGPFKAGDGGGKDMMMKNRDAGERRAEKQKIDQYREIVRTELRSEASGEVQRPISFRSCGLHASLTPNPRLCFLWRNRR